MLIFPSKITTSIQDLANTMTAKERVTEKDAVGKILSRSLRWDSGLGRTRSKLKSTPRSAPLG